MFRKQKDVIANAEATVATANVAVVLANQNFHTAQIALVEARSTLEKINSDMIVAHQASLAEPGCSVGSNQWRT